MLPIKTAFSSFGLSGMVYNGPLLKQHAGFDVITILERNRSDSRTHFPRARLVRNYIDILEDPDVELVIVNTPDHLHADMARLALKKGKHVVVEKPFTQKSSDADELISIAEKKGLVLSVFQNRRWDGDFLTVRKVIDEQFLGRLVSFESHYDRFSNYIQDSWKESADLHTGTLYNLGAHMIDQAMVLFGMPRAIFADVRALRTDSQIDDSFDIHMHYNNVKCLVRGSYLVKEAGPRYILHGTEGSFLKYGLDPQEEALLSGKMPGTKGWGTEPVSEWGLLNTDRTTGSVQSGRIRLETRPGNYLAYYDNIFDVIRQGARLSVRPEEARDVIRVIEAAYKSAEELKVVHL
jgi:predicted dehydrogenase